MTYLKGSHYILGKDQTGFKYRTNTSYGKNCFTPRAPQTAPWASRHSSVAIGSDSENKTSDYAMRFQKTEASPMHNLIQKQASDIKQKLEADSTTITNPEAKIPKTTVQKDNFLHKNSEAKVINTGLDSFSANNIRSTHFAIGPGG